MEPVKARIRRIANILRIVCLIAKIGLIVMMVGTVVQIVAMYINPSVIDKVENMLGSSALFEALELGTLKRISPLNRKGLELGLSLLEMGVLLLYANIFTHLMAHISRDDQPFTQANALRIRRASYAMLLMLVRDPALGVTMFLLTLLFSYIFEYGAYLQEKADKTTRIQEEVIVSLAEITENKSEQTGQHIRRVSEYSRIIGEQMGLSEEAAENLRLASTMHDLGKLMIPSEILEKPGRLTDEEFAEIKKHPCFGEHLLHNVEGETMTLARTIALEHHERYDGRGYPNGEKGEEISLEGRIVAVADVYDALTSRRSYKEAWDPKRAYDEILKGKGTQFDAAVVDAFAAAYDKIDEARRMYADETVCAA